MVTHVNDKMKRADTMLKHRAGSNQNATFSGGRVMADSQPTLPALPVQDGVRFVCVEGFSDYAVGDDGSVWSLREWKGRAVKGQWRKLSPAKTVGYPAVTLCHGPVRRATFVHRLVLEAFVGPCPEKMEACHLDGTRTNNRIENLRWDTKKGNRADARNHGVLAVGERHGMAKLTSKDVLAIRQMKAGGMMQKDIAAVFGIKEGTVSSIVRRRSWQHV